MDNKNGLKNKKTLLIIIAMMVAIIVFSVSVTLCASNNPNLLKGSLKDFNDKIKEDINNLSDSLRVESKSSVEKIKSSKDVCTGEQIGDTMIVKGTVIENTGSEGDATITFTSEDDVYTETVKINSEKITKFSYSLPQGVYNMKIVSNGFQTYEKIIQQDENLKIILKNNDNPNLYEANYLYGNLYYTYTETGALTLYSKGEYDYSNIADEDIISDGDYSKVTILGNIVESQLQKNGVNIIVQGGEAGVALTRLFFNITVANSIGSTFVIDDEFYSYRNMLELYKTQIEYGTCNENNIDEEPCDNAAGGYIRLFGDSKNALTAINVILSVPVNTSVTIKDGVPFLAQYSLGYISTDTLTIPSSVTMMGEYVIPLSNINTLNYNSLLNITDDFASGAVINNIYINSNITEIGDSAFNCSSTFEKICNLNVLKLPDSIVSIGNNAFKNDGIDAVTLPSNLTNIGYSAFEDNDISDLTIPVNVTTIGDKAFKGNPLTRVTIKGNVTRFNNNWINIGFPESLMPE